jgi:two-component system, OmpR family, sensor histidine kinase MtrB
MPREAALPRPVAAARRRARAWTHWLGRVLHTRPRRLLALRAGPRRLLALRVGPRRLLALFADWWRRSLQLRVVTTTLVLSAVVVSLAGYLLMQRFVGDVYANKEKSAANVVEAGLSTASQTQSMQTAPGVNTEPALYGLARRLEPAGEGAGQGFSAPAAYGQGAPYALVVTLRTGLQGPSPSQNSDGNGVYSRGVAVGFYSIPRLPPGLIQAVQNDRDQAQLYVWASMPVGQVATPVAGLLIGAPYGFNSDYQLYYFFPVTAEQASIVAIQRTMLLVGIVAVFLLAAVAWMVTRWVVAPVRLAAHGARRLSAGNLDERMEVRGTDELAALATAFNEMAASLQEKLEELGDLSQVQRQFVSDVSHELRTPLTTIGIAADVLFAAKDEMSPAAKRSAELMQSQLERFEMLLTDLLEISRYDANAATLDAESADVCTIVRQSADVAQQLAERRGMRIEFRLPPGPCIAEVDRRRVERILRNLLQNAVEHGENKDIVVTAAADSAAVAVSVRDYGVGLATGEEHLVFDRFWRADPARARTSGGTGLGLAIALEDARLHRGWLEAWGERGKGSVFRLTLPRTAGGELHGSPLPLRPDQAGLDADLLADLPGLARPGATGVGPDGNGAAGDGNSVGGDGEPAEVRHRTPAPGQVGDTELSARG